MQVADTLIPEVKIIEPEVLGDSRGFFIESYNTRIFEALLQVDISFVQDNHSRSSKDVLRGLHYQIHQPQAKLVRVTSGSVFDVAVDIRKSSPTFGAWVGTLLTEKNHKQMWIPEGFAHGFLVCSDVADFLYKTTDYYAPEHERCIAWNDPTIGIDWPLEGQPIISEKDSRGSSLDDAGLFA
jgi:dTDP-4-dehydrorhamnose 3,5-epimerase